MGMRGGGGNLPLRAVRLGSFHMVIPVGQQVRQRWLYSNLALYEKWKPPETTTCKPGLTQAFLQVAQQAISLIKPLLHFEAFRWNLCAAALWNKFQQALQRVIWSVSWNFFELPFRGKYHVK